MNFLNYFFVLFFSITTMVFVQMIFKHNWYTVYGAKITFRNVRQRWALYLLLLFIPLGILSTINPEMNKGIRIMSQVLAASVMISCAISIYKWSITPDALSFPIDHIVKHYWPHAERIANPSSHLCSDDEHNDVFMIKGVDIQTVFLIYRDFLISIGQKPKREFKILRDLTQGYVMYYFTAEEKTNSYTLVYDHEVMYLPESEIISFGMYVK